MKRNRNHRSMICRSATLEPLEPRQLLAAGDLDKSFSGDGKATIDIGGKFSMGAEDVAVQADGKTVIVGLARPSPTSDTFFVAVARLNLDGTPDTTFGPNGIQTISIEGTDDDIGTCVAIQGDGKIVVGATATVNTVLDETQFGVARFNPDGTLDKTFAGTGRRTIDFVTGPDIAGEAEDVLIQQVGTSSGIVEKIVLVGRSTGLTGDSDFAVARLNPDGKLDSTFDGDGHAKLELGDFDKAEAVAVDSVGRLVVAGGSGSPHSKFAVLRLLNTDNHNGERDGTFGSKGQVLTPFPGAGGAAIEAITIQSGDRIVAVGVDTADFALARYLANGSLDPTFGTAGTGLVQTDFGGIDFASGVIKSADGGLIVAGGSDGKFALASYTADGVLRANFGSGGKLITDFGASAGTVDFLGVGMAKGPGRRFVVASGDHFKTARYLDAGANVVSVGSFDPNATEGGGGFGDASFIVGRVDRLPTPTRVFFTISGTASLNLINFFFSDYSVTGMTLPSPFGGEQRPFVDIPANQTFTTVTFTPLNDARVEGLETAVFSILADASYEIGTPPAATLNIFDDDSTTLNATADSFVRDGTFAGTNFGSEKELQVKTASGGFNRRAYFKFDLSTVSSITSAKVRLFARLNDNQNASVVTQLFSVANTGWSETGINFNNAPAPGLTPLASATIAGTGLLRYEFDVTAFVQAEKAAGRNVVSFMLKDPSASVSVVLVNSREAGSTNSRPGLLIGLSSGTFTVTPRASEVAAGQSLKLAVTWTVPSGGWRKLKDVQLRLGDELGNVIFLIKFDEAANTFSLYNPTTGKFDPGKTPGSSSTLSRGGIKLNLAGTSVKAAGPTAPSVVLTFDLSFENTLIGRDFFVQAAASDDQGHNNDFEFAGTIAVIH